MIGCISRCGIQPIIAPTYGQIIYQEQVMRILREVGNLSWQDVCDIRNIMGKSKGSEAFDKYWPKWLEGIQSTGYGEADARQIWETIRLYGKHSFNLSHSVAYGIVAYLSMYMKCHYPREFYWAQLIKAPDDARSGRYIGEALRRGISFSTLSLSLCGATWTLGADGTSIAPGWSALKGVGEKAAAELSSKAPFASMDDLIARVNRRVVNRRVQAVIQEALEMSVEQLYGLDQWDAIDKLAPYRDTILAVNEGELHGEQAVIVGRVTRINKKNRVEEAKTKGKDWERIVAEGKLTDYCILIVEDDTDSIMVYLAPDQYKAHHNKIWTCQDTFVKIAGRKLGGVQLINMRAVEWDMLGTGREYHIGDQGGRHIGGDVPQ